MSRVRSPVTLPRLTPGVSLWRPAGPPADVGAVPAAPCGAPVSALRAANPAGPSRVRLTDGIGRRGGVPNPTPGRLLAGGRTGMRGRGGVWGRHRGVKENPVEGLAFPLEGGLGKRPHDEAAAVTPPARPLPAQGPGLGGSPRPRKVGPRGPGAVPEVLEADVMGRGARTAAKSGRAAGRTPASGQRGPRRRDTRGHPPGSRRHRGAGVEGSPEPSHPRPETTEPSGTGRGRAGLRLLEVSGPRCLGPEVRTRFPRGRGRRGRARP